MVEKTQALKSITYKPEAIALEVQESIQYIDNGVPDSEKYFRYVYFPDEVLDEDEYQAVKDMYKLFFTPVACEKYEQMKILRNALLNTKEVSDELDKK